MYISKKKARMILIYKMRKDKICNMYVEIVTYKNYIFFFIKKRHDNTISNVQINQIVAKSIARTHFPYQATIFFYN